MSKQAGHSKQCPDKTAGQPPLDTNMHDMGWLYCPQCQTYVKENPDVEDAPAEV